MALLLKKLLMEYDGKVCLEITAINGTERFMFDAAQQYSLKVESFACYHEMIFMTSETDIVGMG